MPSARGGARKLAVSDEAALSGILFVLQTGIPWEDLPQSLGYGSGMTYWRRLRIVVDARGIALVILVSGANRHDTKMFEKCVGAIPAIAGLTGRPRKRSAKLRAYKGYDFKQSRAHLRQRGMIG